MTGSQKDLRKHCELLLQAAREVTVQEDRRIHLLCIAVTLSIIEFAEGFIDGLLEDDDLPANALAGVDDRLRLLSSIAMWLALLTTSHEMTRFLSEVVPSILRSSAPDRMLIDDSERRFRSSPPGLALQHFVAHVQEQLAMESDRELQEVCVAPYRELIDGFRSAVIEPTIVAEERTLIFTIESLNGQDTVR